MISSSALRLTSDSKGVVGVVIGAPHGRARAFILCRDDAYGYGGLGTNLAGCRLDQHFASLPPNVQRALAQAGEVWNHWKHELGTRQMLAVRSIGGVLAFADLLHVHVGADIQVEGRAFSREPSGEPAKHVGSKPAPGHPWRHGYEQRMKLQRLNRSQESALVGVSASATP
jgi:hypothetical protein